MLALGAMGALTQTLTKGPSAADKNLPFKQVSELNGQVLRLLGSAQSAGISQESNLQIDAASVFDRRLTALEALVERDPKRALLMTFPPELLEELIDSFPHLKNKLESHGHWQGPVEHLVVDGAGFATSKSIARMKSGNEELFLHFASKAPRFQSSDVISVRGVRAGGRIAVDEVEATPAPTSTTTVSCSTIGPQSIAVILVNFKNSTLPPGLTPSRVRSIFLGNSAGGPQKHSGLER